MQKLDTRLKIKLQKCENVWRNLVEFRIRRGAKTLFMVFLLDSKGAKACKSCRSRQELSNEYLLVLAKFGFDTADNPSQPASRERASKKKLKVRINVRKT